MSPRAKKRWLWVGAIVVFLFTLNYLDAMRVRYVTFDEAQEMANKRFLTYAEGYHLPPSDFGPPQIQDRGDEWLFKWRALKREGAITVIIRRNGEIFDGGDERLEPS